MVHFGASWLPRGEAREGEEDVAAKSGLAALGKYKLDFKVGGRETSRGDLPDGQMYTYDAMFQDIVPNERIIYSYDMTFGGQRISVSVTTVELKPAGKGTKLTFTEQGAFLDGLDNPAQREAGTKQILDKLGTTLKA